MLKEIVEKLNQQNIRQKTMDWMESIPEDLWKKYFSEELAECVETITTDYLRHHEAGIKVYEYHDEKDEWKYLGVYCVTNYYSEDGDVASLYHQLYFQEMEKVEKTEIIYRQK